MGEKCTYMHLPPTPHLDMKSQRREGWAGKAQNPCVIYRLSNRGSFDTWYQSILEWFSHFGGQISSTDPVAKQWQAHKAALTRRHPEFPPFISYFQMVKDWLLFFSNNRWTIELPWSATRTSKLFFACIWILVSLHKMWSILIFPSTLCSQI